MNYEDIYQKRYQGLNDQQRAAVDQIYGPVIVVAGPGTGKTELLSMRAANILRQTDLNPNNILCLTYTESASVNMTERLAKIIGPSAYQVTINTFHGFGSSIISRYGEYFYQGAEFSPASELAKAETINDILLDLPLSNPLSKRCDNKASFLKECIDKISNFKRAGLSPDQLRQINNQNQEFVNLINPMVNYTFSDRISPKNIDRYYKLLTKAEDISSHTKPLNFTVEPTLSSIFTSQLQSAIHAYEETIVVNKNGSTSQITQFKKYWTEKNSVTKDISLKETTNITKINALIDVFEKYQKAMAEKKLFDFSDMIMDVKTAITNNPSLKASLQEQYQFILVDEFQDTNDAQMSLLNLLTDYDDQPNLMVVGDDDQSIYRFQGADIFNIQNFAKRFDNPTQIDLNINYRSTADILGLGSKVAQQIEQRLKNSDGSDKIIKPCQNNQKNGHIEHLTTSLPEQEWSRIAHTVRDLINKGQSPKDIAIISRRNKTLETIAYYLAELNIPVSYDKNRNIFESQLVQLLVHLATIIVGIANGNPNQIDSHLKYIVAEEAFGFKSEDFYKIALLAQKNRQTSWIKTVDDYNDNGHKLVSWLKSMAQKAVNESLDVMMPLLMGIQDREQDDSNQKSDSFISPIFNYYLSDEKLLANNLNYLSFLIDYQALNSELTAFYSGRNCKLVDLVNFSSKVDELEQSVNTKTHYGSSDGVQLITAHSAKGQEFETVFIVDAVNNVWGSSAKHRSKQIKLPDNLPIDGSGDSEDEKRRLFFVAITRAKKNLYITAHGENNGKPLLELEYLAGLTENKKLPDTDYVKTIEDLETNILAPIKDKSVDSKHILQAKLDEYKLSATDLIDFVDVKHNGPKLWLQYKLLRVPQLIKESLVLGSAVHSVMEYLHNYTKSDNHPGQLPDKDTAISYFNKLIINTRLNDQSLDNCMQRGKIIIDNIYLSEQYNFNKNQIPELWLETVLPKSGVRIAGKIDLVSLDPATKTISVTDYKTGSSYNSLTSSSDKPHKHRLQLMFYKLLIENSKEYNGWKVIEGDICFVEPDKNSQIIRPSISLQDDDAMNEFTKLVEAVWTHMQRLNLPNISDYKNKSNGITKFEEFLIESSKSIKGGDR